MGKDWPRLLLPVLPDAFHMKCMTKSDSAATHDLQTNMPGYSRCAPVNNKAGIAAMDINSRRHSICWHKQQSDHTCNPVHLQSQTPHKMSVEK